MKSEEYLKRINDEVNQAYKFADAARKKGLDPENRVDVPLAKNMAERVVGLVSIVAPQLKGTGMIKRIQELEKEYGKLDWRISLIIAKEVALERFCKFDNKLFAMETGIRVGFAYHTNGIVAAPLEGFIALQIKKRKDGKEYFSMKFSGPIRGAGGTAEAFSVVICDYVRKEMGYAKYDPTEDEVRRYMTEVRDYHERITNLQYFPSNEELEFLASRVPIEINGDPTEKMEVSNYKDLPRVETNRIRGGVCLVLAEGISQKAKKLWKRLSVFGEEFGLEWGFLKNFLELQEQKRAKEKSKTKKSDLEPNYTFIFDLVAGRPILTYPLRPGGFRLRYGRTRTSGYSAAGIHPATQLVLDNYIATGTQLKVERPGKATSVTPTSSIDPPIVRLTNGSVIRLTSIKKAKENLGNIAKVLFLGDILFNYGDFSENGHKLVPPGYCEEWWVQEFEKSIVDLFGVFDLEKTSEFTNVPVDLLSKVVKEPLTPIPSKEAFMLSEKLGIPLHSNHTAFWSLISPEDLSNILSWFEKANLENFTGPEPKIVLPMKKDSKSLIEKIGLPHQVVSNEFVIFTGDEAMTLKKLFNLGSEKQITSLSEEQRSFDNALDSINSFSKIFLRDKAGTFIGARMGRPEKAKMRKLKGSPHSLFPVGVEGGRLRSFQSALEVGKIKTDFPIFECSKCGEQTINRVCEICGKITNQLFNCYKCGILKSKNCEEHGPCRTYQLQEIDIKHYFEKALNKLSEKVSPDLVKGIRRTSNKDRLPENLAKGILRAKHEIFVNKDGTTRYDMTELPMTHFKPFEIKVSVEKLKTLGYDKDIKGKDLVSKDQVVELKPQDLILPGVDRFSDESAATVLVRVAQFIDDLLVRFYGLKPFYNVKSKDDLLGQLVIGLAPHISAGTIGRIIGFSETQGCYAHPMWHASLRRDCDGDEACVIMLMDALLNFSRQFLPDKIGTRTMDSPLVLTSTITPSEVDDMVHGLDVVWKYPLEFYKSALEFKNPWDVSIEQLKSRIDTEKQYYDFGFTHKVEDINSGVLVSAYKTLPSMSEKLDGQMEIAKKLSAVDESDVARLVIEKHFLKDLKGNLRIFSTQKFRCVSCNAKFRRPPLKGNCTGCGSRLLFTVSEGSIQKYLGLSFKIAEDYNVDPYVKQSLNLVKLAIEGVFGKEKEKQEALQSWF